jgi:hypothetical protein
VGRLLDALRGMYYVSRFVCNGCVEDGLRKRLMGYMYLGSFKISMAGRWMGLVSTFGVDEGD